MNLSNRNRNIVLWLVSIGLLVSMMISFTPGTLFGNRGLGQETESPGVLEVNGELLRETDIARARQNPPFNLVQEGQVGEDLTRLMLDQLVSQKLLEEASAGIEVSNAEVREQVSEFREAQGVAGTRNDRAYQNLLAGAGYTDATFRELIRVQEKQEKYLEGLGADAEITDAQIETFYKANKAGYLSEPRITARQIVVTGSAEANQLYAQALSGADFAALAREHSTDRAEQGGALGAAAGESAPKPVTRVALPTAVADAAFGLQGAGLTRPVQAGGAYHIVKVESYQPPEIRPLEEVREDVRSDLEALQKAAAEENALTELKASAQITSPSGSAYSYDNPTVAKVGDYAISAVELDRTTYLNPQIQQLLSPGLAELIVNSVKPNVLQQLIDEALAFKGAETLDAAFVGTRSAVAQSALGYVSRDVTVSAQEVRTFYNENIARYTREPTAFATRLNFENEAEANAFRRQLVQTPVGDLETLKQNAVAAGATADDLGTLNPGAQPQPIDEALFSFGPNGMVALGDTGFELSGVIPVEVPAPAAASGGAGSGGVGSGGAGSEGAGAQTSPQNVTQNTTQYVLLVAARAPETVQPLADVRTQVQQAALQAKQAQAQQTWLDEQRAAFPVENLLASVTGAGAASGGAASGGAASEGAGGMMTGGAPTESE